MNLSVAPLRMSGRRRSLAILSIVTVAGAIAWAGWAWFAAGDRETTDNAYVQGDIVHLTPQIGGTVVSVLAGETQLVQQGQVVVQLDPAEAQIALAEAQANLAQTVRQVRSVYAMDAQLGALVALREAEESKSRSELSKLEDDLRRRASLADSGAVSREEVAHANVAVANARSSLAAAQAAIRAAQEQLASNRTMTDGTDIEAHPNVQLAAAKMREAWLMTKRTTLLAPVSGQVARRTVQIGQRVAAGTPLLSIIPLDHVWVEANFKEAQLRRIRIGQPVKLTADVYGNKVEYDGVVSGLGAGTGAAFALLPAQNATGNWIKVVQRVPVRVSLQPSQIAANPLRVGLSMHASVDVSRGGSGGVAPADGKPSAPPAPPPVAVAPPDDGADAAVRRVILAHAGRTAQARSSPPASPPPALPSALRPASAQRPG
ncbi:HlyD family efflux transporter periplasmic adaptor subunit [Ramlibacter sp.]|uniref:HlyD family efflux transporter periplasmic adaptor subunit n=1 Tax=Ramlibacter sp. TaxID=1917967 RepID=UPI003D0B043C